ncbi:L-2-amino-thiazoline-4-carboxylic acid hydrolase [Mesorhizobium sp. LjNodule214]|uniref:L-2-amino-thiazoline-4-carboxylic acid hydrolase n=1 Tax=Mesorhizobium sp. LjNodule214 TaxID=3342252 RepID=UPI003ECE54D1
MTDPAARAENLSRELDSAFRNRADLYRLFLDELTAELGAERAEAVMIRTIEQRGREVAASAFADFSPNDAPAIGEAFLAVSPDGGRMYPTDVERSEHRIAFKVRRCPLKDAWVEAGVGEEKLATLCRIAGAFDRGLFEATGVRFDNVTWTPGHGSGCCHIALTNRDAG